MAKGPLIVDVTRGPAIESRHAVHALLMDGAGRIVESYGDSARPTFPRSCIKPLQAIALVESGAADAFHLSEEELALACASHSGEEMHTSRVSLWLERLGRDDSVLECGGHAPVAAPCAPAAVLANNCSGKHTGMVTLSLFMKEDPKGYTLAAHPAQKRILQAVGEVCGLPLTADICGVDGCSAPAPILPLENLARGFAAFMSGNVQGAERARACARLYKAVTSYPELVGGTGRLDTVLMAAAKGRLLCKTGAEGVYIAFAPEKDRVLVLKAEDGATRAAQAALFHLLEKHGMTESAVLEAARSTALPILKNWRGTETGVVSVPAVA